MTARNWQKRGLGPPLPGSHEVHVWRVRVSDREAIRTREQLSPGEKERADRFHQLEDRWRFTVGRALLRAILGGYLNLDPRSLSFTYSETGKPALDDACNPAGLSFSVAHSGEYVLLAFGAGLALGVDIEHLRLERDFDLLMKSLLPPSRYAQLLLKPAEIRKRLILQEWTRREAFGKALGGGIATALAGYQAVSADSAGWSIGDLEAADDYVAALAVQTRDLQLSLYDCQDGSCIP